LVIKFNFCFVKFIRNFTNEQLFTAAVFFICNLTFIPIFNLALSPAMPKLNNLISEYTVKVPISEGCKFVQLSCTTINPIMDIKYLKYRAL
jgi:hypothetical protein